MKIIFESLKYYNAIYEVQSKIRNKLKWENLTQEEDDILEWVSDMIIEELNERNLKHYWHTREE